MRTLVVFSALSLALLFFVACTKSGSPSCTDESVKKLVLDISAVEFRNQLTSLACGNSGRHHLAGFSYDSLNDLKNKMSLANIRVNGKRDDIKKCECGGDLALSDGKTHPITYTAQFTEDGKVHVEVAGLKQRR